MRDKAIQDAINRIVANRIMEIALEPSPFNLVLDNEGIDLDYFSLEVESNA